MSEPRTLYIEKGPSRFNYFVKDGPRPLEGRSLGQAMTLGGARRLARRLLRQRWTYESHYVIVETVTDMWGSDA